MMNMIRKYDVVKKGTDTTGFTSFITGERWGMEGSGRWKAADVAVEGTFVMCMIQLPPPPPHTHLVM